MARKQRIHFPGAYYHVILRGNNRNPIFFSNEDKEYFYSLIDEGIKRYHYQVHAFCLMTNHVHLVIQVSDTNLSKLIQNISFRYAYRINTMRGQTGHVFQGRYKAILIDAEQYLLELVRYIHLNPVRAKMVNDPKEYFWSSHRAYMNLEKIDWLTCNYFLGYFGTDSGSICILKEYEKFMSETDFLPNEKHFITGNYAKFYVLGNEEFLKKLNQKIKTKLPLKLENIVSFICWHYSISEESLFHSSRIPINVKIRALIAWLAKEFDVCTYEQVGAFFKRDPTGFIRKIRRLENSSDAIEEMRMFKDLIEKSFCQA